MFNYDTPAEAIKDLATRGYSIDFNLDANKTRIVVENNVIKQSISLSPEDFEIDEFYRFEGDSNPGDEMVVYAISSKSHKVKGVLVNAFGPYSNTGASKIIEKLSAHIQQNKGDGKRI